MRKASARADALVGVPGRRSRRDRAAPRRLRSASAAPSRRRLRLNGAPAADPRGARRRRLGSPLLRCLSLCRHPAACAFALFILLAAVDVGLAQVVEHRRRHPRRVGAVARCTRHAVEGWTARRTRRRRRRRAPHPTASLHRRRPTTAHPPARSAGAGAGAGAGAEVQAPAPTRRCRTLVGGRVHPSSVERCAPVR